MKNALLLYFAILTMAVNAQSKRVLFIGNSYTYVNNLPQMIADIALTQGDTMYYDSNLIGGQTLQGHAQDLTGSVAKIMQGGFDFVILQDQSAHPSFPDSMFQTETVPYARALDSLINLYNPCAETMFFMTWGYQNGNTDYCITYPNWPYACTYEVMDSLTNLRYRMLADSNHAVVSPVGRVWHYIRDNYPWINLYQVDGSHPSMAGSYAAACTFYATLFRKDPSLNTLTYALADSDATYIRNAAKTLVYDSLLQWRIGTYDVSAHYTIQNTANNELAFTNLSVNADNYTWDFGDGATSTDENPVHQFSSAGIYEVSLIASHCNDSDTMIAYVYAGTVGINSAEEKAIWSFYFNSDGSVLHLKTNQNGNYSYSIVNPPGEIITGESFHEMEIRIDTAFLTSGVYVIQVRKDNQPVLSRNFYRIKS